MSPKSAHVINGTVVARGWMLLATAVGLLLGLGLFAFWYARGWSYMTSDPAACANCHIMQAYYDAWNHGSHRHVATCNDCHAPATFVGKWATKARNGYNHSLAFTTGDFVEPLAITSRNHQITEGQCRYCHATMVEQIDHGEGISCTRCHAQVGHAE